MRRLVPWLAVATLTAALTALTVSQALVQYRALQSGWSWDVAYYNQWFWALTLGDGQITVRPIASYAEDGPSVWKMNYLAPIRFAIAPIYRLTPGPETLLVVQCVLFWWLIPAAYTLAKSETGSDLAALAAVALVPATPLLWPLVWNDFRELQLALPFVLWAVQGYRCRRFGLTAVGVAGMLACRQELALVVASLAILPPRDEEDAGRTYLWAQTALVVGLGWMLFAFFGYLKAMVGPHAPENYLAQFGGPKAPLAQTLETGLDFLLVGTGAWAVLAWLSPRAALLALPWVWSLASGRWALRFLASEQWHHVRYTAMFVPLVVAAGLIGYGRLYRYLRRHRGGMLILAVVWLQAAVGQWAALTEVRTRLAYVPPPISPIEAAEVWPWIEQVGPEEAVMATYEVTAPLSSRRRLYSYILNQNTPKGYPHLGPEFRWAFMRRESIDTQVLKGEGFDAVHEGLFLSILHRDEKNPPPDPKILPDGANKSAAR
jgi:uncharacterized membrane protein